MRKVLLLALCFSLLTTCAFAELSQSDFQRIQSIVEKTVEKSEKQIKDYVDLKINALDAKLSGEIKTLDEKLIGEINALDAKLSGEIKTLDEKLTGGINGLDGRLNQLFLLVIALIALIAVAVGMPHILVARQGKEIRSQNQRIEALQQEIETIRHEMNERNVSTS